VPLSIARFSWSMANLDQLRTQLEGLASRDDEALRDLLDTLGVLVSTAAPAPKRLLSEAASALAAIVAGVAPDPELSLAAAKRYVNAACAVNAPLPPSSAAVAEDPELPVTSVPLEEVGLLRRGGPRARR
jgi:hypothetical protein